MVKSRYQPQKGISMLARKVRTTIVVIAASGGLAAMPAGAYALVSRAPLGTVSTLVTTGSLALGTGGGVYTQPTIGTTGRYVNGTGSAACQKATDAANSWQSAGTQADLDGNIDDANKDYKYADTIAGEANAGPNDCVIYEPQ
jgi:hypothetical protein